MQTRTRGLVLGMYSAWMAFLVDWLFFHHPVGWNLALFLLGGGIIVMLRSGAYARSRAAYIAGLALLGALIALASQPGPLVFLLSGCLLVFFAMTLREGTAPDAVAWLQRVFFFAFKSVIQPILDLRRLILVRKRGGRESVFSFVWKFLGRWTLPVAGSAFFLGLFTIANPVLSLELNEGWNALGDLWQYGRIDPGRCAMWFYASVGAWSLMRVRTLIGRRSAALDPAPSIPMTPGIASLLVRCLLLFNTVFAIQTLLDLTYLWGGRALPGNMTYAEYAHRGSYPLIATAILAALFVLAAFRSGPPTRETTRARRLVLFWLAQNICLTFSAAWRLHMYSEVYGLTRLRVAAAIWMFLVASGLAWIGLRIQSGNSNRWLVSRNLVTTAVVLYMCCFVNFEGMIAWHNARNSKEAGGSGQPLDYQYMYQLGPESIPALVWMRIGVKAFPKNDTERYLRERLEGQLSDWRGWTYRRSILASTH